MIDNKIKNEIFKVVNNESEVQSEDSIWKNFICFLKEYRKWFEDKDNQLLKHILNYKQYIDEYINTFNLTDEEKAEFLSFQKKTEMKNFIAILEMQNYKSEDMKKMMCNNFDSSYEDIEIENNFPNTILSSLVNVRTDFLNKQFKNFYYYTEVLSACLQNKIAFDFSKYLSIKNEVFTGNVDTFIKEIAENYCDIIK